MDMNEVAPLMKEILGLTYEPIAVKFLAEKTQLDGFDMPSGGDSNLIWIPRIL